MRKREATENAQNGDAARRCRETRRVAKRRSGAALVVLSEGDLQDDGGDVVLVPGTARAGGGMEGGGQSLGEATSACGPVLVPGTAGEGGTGAAQGSERQAKEGGPGVSEIRKIVLLEIPYLSSRTTGEGRMALLHSHAPRRDSDGSRATRSLAGSGPSRRGARRASTAMAAGARGCGPRLRVCGAGRSAALGGQRKFDHYSGDRSRPIWRRPVRSLLSRGSSSSTP